MALHDDLESDPRTSKFRIAVQIVRVVRGDVEETQMRALRPMASSKEKCFLRAVRRGCVGVKRLV